MKAGQLWGGRPVFFMEGRISILHPRQYPLPQLFRESFHRYPDYSQGLTWTTHKVIREATRLKAQQLLLASENQPEN